MTFADAHAIAAPTTSSSGSKGTPCAFQAAMTADAGRGDQPAKHLEARGPFAKEDGREGNREEDLQLYDERGQPGRHPEADGDEQQAELHDAERGSRRRPPAPPGP